MTHDGRLFWVQANRKKRGSAQTIGEVVDRFTRRLLDAQTAATRRVVGRIQAVVDDEFRCHCRVIITEGGRLAVHVDQPGLVCAMRLRWESRLRAALSAGALTGQGPAISFVHGVAGVSLDAGGRGRAAPRLARRDQSTG